EAASARQRRSRVVPRFPSPRHRSKGIRPTSPEPSCVEPLRSGGAKKRVSPLFQGTREGSMFEPVNARYDGPTLEKKILELWEREDVFRRVLEATRERPRFVFYEGPPTANGKPGIHHVLARTFKDLYPRYKTMRGFHVPRKAGWDTHGLPV